MALTPLRSETIRILGENYPFQSRVNDENRMLESIEYMWKLWKDNKLVLPNSDKLNSYISPDKISNEIKNILQK